MGKSIFKRFEKYAASHSFRFQSWLTLLFFMVYVCIITLGFMGTSQRIEESGFSTADLQNSVSRGEVQDIVGAWASVINYVNFLYVFDYIFILSGILLFLSLNALLLKKFRDADNLHILPKLGLILTLLSRSMDGLENLFTILIYTNPNNFNISLLSLLSTTSAIKWILVTLEYSVVLIGWIFVLVIKIRKKKQ